MSAYRAIQILIYLISFAGSMYALSCVRFDLFCNVKQVPKVRLLLVIVAAALAFACGQFLLMFLVLS